MDLRHLQIFQHVCRHRSVSAAADELGMSQPALSKLIRRLEGELGVPLFDRLPRGLEPTRTWRKTDRFLVAGSGGCECKKSRGSPGSLAPFSESEDSRQDCFGNERRKSTRSMADTLNIPVLRFPSTHTR